ncbi:ATP-binding cassette domain-containing protein [Parapedobacter sp. ISTM3]|uniref:ATP-binding cassette domain-containing protein n=1 Tax=Parapedobacter sp. ISTM3 TaxID=2800130 RepID=UPI001905F4F7|nr:ATP-binding cassette domain-containing protein [Parapedobacter sp. ISTM3]MBK1438997.1 ATP-binding cassette domain-containing protein [Parapedobacter sp. ISTM3]
MSSIATAPPFTLLEMTGATLVRNGAIVLQHAGFCVQHGQQWAIIGEPETAKNYLLQALAGKVVINQGAVHHFHASSYLQAGEGNGGYRTHHDLVAYVPFHHHFRSKSNTQNFYYQQRFNSADADDAATVRELLSKTRPKHNDIRWTTDDAITLFGLDKLADKALIKLSNGETRRLMLATALVKNPNILLLDHPLVGLDVEARSRFEGILQAIIQSGIHVIMATTPQEIPSCMTHVAVIENDTIAIQGPVDQIYLNKYRQLATPGNVALPDAMRGTIRTLFEQRTTPAIGSPIISMNDVSVRYGDKLILDGINWRVEQGEAWSLKGHNGAGKSTLLSLINGDNPQAYSNDIILFGRKRGTGESIWDIKKQIGYVSPELHQYFPKNQTVLQVVLSGYFDTVGLFRKVAPAQREAAVRWLQLFGLSDAIQQRLALLSPDKQRLCLLARAIIKNPNLLILDEPCQGLSPQHRDLFKALMDEIHAVSGTTIIYVSHYEEDIPSCVTKYIRLEQGRIKL